MKGAVRVPLVLLIFLFLQALFLPILIASFFLFPMLTLGLWIGKVLLKQLFKLIFIKYYKQLDNNLLNSIGIENPNLIIDDKDEVLKPYNFKGKN